MALAIATIIVATPVLTCGIAGSIVGSVTGGLCGLAEGVLYLCDENSGKSDVSTVKISLVLSGKTIVGVFYGAIYGGICGAVYGAITEVAVPVMLVDNGVKHFCKLLPLPEKGAYRIKLEEESTDMFQFEMVEGFTDPVSYFFDVNSVKWIEEPKKEQEYGNGYIYSWSTIKWSFKKHFGIQEWGKLLDHPCRIVLFDESGKNVIPIAEFKNHNDGLICLTYLSNLELSDKFTQQEMWEALSKGTPMKQLLS